MFIAYDRVLSVQNNISSSLCTFSFFEKEDDPRSLHLSAILLIIHQSKITILPTFVATRMKLMKGCVWSEPPA